MGKLLRRTAVVGALVAAPIAFAVPAQAQPIFGCAPCVNVPGTDEGGNPIEVPTPIWNAFFDGTDGVFGNGAGLWETGVTAINGGLQEGLADATDGVPGDGQGAWEKVFPPAG